MAAIFSRNSAAIENGLARHRLSRGSSAAARRTLRECKQYLGQHALQFGSKHFARAWISSLRKPVTPLPAHDGRDDHYLGAGREESRRAGKPTALLTGLNGVVSKPGYALAVQPIGGGFASGGRWASDRCGLCSL